MAFSSLLTGEDELSDLTAQDLDAYTMQPTENSDLLNGSLFTVMYTSGSTGTPKGSHRPPRPVLVLH